MRPKKVELLCHFDRINSEAGLCGVAQQILNLREVEGGLVVVGDCKQKFTLSQSERFLLVIKENGIDRFVTSIGTSIYINSIKVGDTLGEIIDAKVVGHFIVVSTTSRYYFFKCNSTLDYTPVNIKDAIPEFRFEAVENVSVPKPVAGYILKGGVPTEWVNPLNILDVKEYTALVRDAYNNNVNEAISEGCWVQPIVVRCAVRLWDNSFLWVGAPIVVGNGYQGIDYQRSAVSFAQGEILPATYLLKSYRVGVKVDKGTNKEWDSLIKSIEIYTCDEPNIVRKSGNLNYRCETSTVSGQRKYYLSYALPCSNIDVTTSQLANSKSWRLLTRITDYEKLRVGIISAIGVNLISDANLGSVYSIKRNEIFHVSVLSTEWAQVEHHTIIPATMMVANGQLHSGNITARLNCDWALRAFGSLDSDGNGSIAVMKINVGESVVVWSGTLTSSRLNAIIAFPDARATQVEVSVLRQGRVWLWKGHLIPSISEDMAYYVSPDLTPIQLTATSSTVLTTPPQENIDTSYHNQFIISKAENPFVAMKRDSIADSKIIALRSAIRPVTTSIFSRYPLYAFTTNGIYAIASTNNSSDVGQPRCIDSRILVNESLIAYSSRGIYFVAGTDLCLLSGATVEIISHNIEATSLAWSSVYNELWCVSNTGNASVYIEKAKRWYNRDIYIIQLKADYNNAIAIAVGGKIIDINQEIKSSQHIYYRSYPISINERLKSINWHILMTHSAIELQVTGENGDSCHGDIINIVKVSGELRAPLKLPIYAPVKRVIRLIIDGNADANMLIYPVIIE